MTAYADTGFLCSLYAPDAHTGAAVARIKRQTLPLPFTWLHQLELLSFDRHQHALALAAGLRAPVLV